MFISDSVSGISVSLQMVFAAVFGGIYVSPEAGRMHFDPPDRRVLHDSSRSRCRLQTAPFAPLTA
jgi:hypothetical protein